MSKLFVSNLPAVTIVINAASEKALHAAADIGRNQWAKNLTGSRSGKVYRLRPNKTVAGGRARFESGERSATTKHAYYTASRPGEYPAVQWGDLMGSIRIKPKGDAFLIGTDIEHGLILEKKNPSKGGRPHAKPSLDQAKPAMIAKLNQRWF